MLFTYDLTLDIVDNNIQVVTLKQYTEKAWNIHVQLTQHGEPLHISPKNYACNIKWVTSKKHCIFQECSVNMDGSIDLVPRTACFLDAGIGKAELNLIDVNSGAYYASMGFYVSVISSVFDDENIEASDDYRQFVDYLTTVENLDTKIQYLQSFIDDIDSGISSGVDNYFKNYVDTSITDLSADANLATIGAIKYYVQSQQYHLPIATENKAGGVKPVSRDENMTQNVGVDASGRLYTYPTSVMLQTKVVNSATSEDLGGVKADIKTDLDTIPVRIGTNDKLYVSGKIPSPGKLIFTGDLNFSYDGSKDVVIPVAFSNSSGSGSGSGSGGGTTTILANCWYGSCAEPGNIQHKTVEVSSAFDLTIGTVVYVRFDHAQLATNPTLNVNNTGDLLIVNNHTPLTHKSIQYNNWSDGEVVAFVYDGSYWVAIGRSFATTETYGITKLNDTLYSNSTTEAATANAVRQVSEMISNYIDSQTDRGILTMTLTNEYQMVSEADVNNPNLDLNLTTQVTVFFGNDDVTDECEFNIRTYGVDGEFNNQQFQYIVHHVYYPASYVEIEANYKTTLKEYNVHKKYSLVILYNGSDGLAGRGIIGTNVTYCIANQGTEIPITEWDEEIPETTDEEPFLWTQTVYYYSDETETVSYSVSRNGHQGVDGQSTLSVIIDSSQGTIFKAGVYNSILTAYVYYGMTDVTNKVSRSIWQRVDQNGELDPYWVRETDNNVIAITNDDVWNKAKFTCTVEIDI